MRKLDNLGSDQVRHKYRRWLQAGNFGFRKKRNCTIRVVKTKALISFPSCVFVFPYADCWFFHAAAHITRLSVANALKYPIILHLHLTQLSLSEVSEARLKNHKYQCLVFAPYIEQYLSFLNLKFQAFSYSLWVYSLVCVTLGQKSRFLVFFKRRLI